MTSARSFGNYDLPSSLADLVDNSIKAHAHLIEIRCLYNGGEPTVSVVDDGEGMSEAQLLDAMRPANTNPLKERSVDDLGRFGWGMKSASFSQCQSLTVISSQSGRTSGAVWNLRDVDKWKMGVLSQAEIERTVQATLLDRNGTEVLWQDCDRLSEDGSLTEDKFNEFIVYTRLRLGLVFHRYLSGTAKGKKISIRVNGSELDPYDPFYQENDATQKLEMEMLRIGAARIKIQPYILPHYSKLGLSEYDRLAGPEGILKNQGFYVYRQHRLIISGTWFRLVRHGELSQLVRISVDIPNSIDALWKITIDKSDAQLPAALHSRLEQIVGSLKKRSAKVIRSKGGRLDRPGRIPVWSRHARGGQVRYSLNREHPLIAAVLDEGNVEQSELMKATLQTIEQSVPVQDIGKDSAQQPDNVNQTISDPRILIQQLDVALPHMLFEVDGDRSKLIRLLKIAEPYAQNWVLVHDHLVQKGWLHDKPRK